MTNSDNIEKKKKKGKTKGHQLCPSLQAQEKQQLQEQLSGHTAAHAQELQCLWDEMQWLQKDAAHAAHAQQLAQLERHRRPRSLGRSAGGCSCSSGAPQGSPGNMSWSLEGARWAGLRLYLPSAFLQRLVEMEAVKLPLGKERDALIPCTSEQSQAREGKRVL